MRHHLSLDLKVARRQAGLTQRDCAHLLGVSASRVAKLERGQRGLQPDEVATLCLVYGRTFEGLFDSAIRDARRHLTSRLETLPEPPKRGTHLFNRQHTLSALADRLFALDTEDRGV